MDAVKGAADALRGLVYEVAGLALPGAAAILAIAFALGTSTGVRVLAETESHVWIAIGAAYLLGFPLQAVSRPVTRSIRWAAWAVGNALPWLARMVGWTEGARALRDRWAQVAAFFDGRRPGRDGILGTADDTYDDAFDFATACNARWTARLALPPTHRLSAFQLDALCYSVLERRESIDRFRAATSLCRAMSTVVALAAAVRLWSAWRAGPIDWPATAAAFAGVSALFWAFTQREQMYERLRTEALLAQSLASGWETPPSSGAAAPPVVADRTAALRVAPHGHP